MAFTRSAKLTIGIMAMMGILITYVETMVTPALPILVSDFHTNYDSLSWVITAYILSGTVSAAIFGRLADMYGKKRIFIILAGVYSLAVAFGGFATDLPQFIAVRAVQGIGMGMFPVAYALLNDEVPKENLALAQGIISSTFTGGAAIGLVAGAYITQYYGWQWSYHSAIPISIALLVAAIVVVKESPVRRKERIDFAGISALSLSVILLILGLSEGEYWGWSSSAIVGSFAFSIVALAAFVFIERSVAEPFISLRLLRIRNIFLANVAGLFAMTGMFFLFYTVPVLLQDPSPSGFGMSIFHSGLIMLPAAIASMIFAPLSARITNTRGPKVTILIGGVVLFLSYLALLFNRQTSISILEDTTLLGISLSFVFVGVINILLVSTPRKDAGVSTGMNVVFRNIGSAIAPAIGGVLESTYVMPVLLGTYNYPVLGLPYFPIFETFPSGQAFDYIYLVGLVFLAIMVILTLFMKNEVIGRGRDSSTERNEAKDNRKGETIG